MFCIKSDVITLGSIEMYGLVTVWTSMDDGPYWVTVLKYASHDMRHTCFRRLTVVNRTLGFWGVTKYTMEKAKKRAIYFLDDNPLNYDRIRIVQCNGFK